MPQHLDQRDRRAVRSPREAQPPGGRLLALDGLRLLAALAVMLYHLTARVNPGVNGLPSKSFPHLVAVTRWGSVGVQLFFVVSGFVILMTVWEGDLRSFVASRVSRLLPAYWASVLVNTVLFGVLWRTGYAVLHDGGQVSLLQVLANLTMVQSLLGQPDLATSYWTLWPEILFYLGMALLIRRGITANRVLAVAFVWPLLSLVVDQVPVLETLLITRWAPFFAGGMALYLIYRNGHALLPWLVVGFNTVLGVRVVIDFQSSVMPAGTGIGSDPMIAGMLGALCFAAVALVTVTPLARVGGRWLLVAGAVTYPLYLTHEAVGWFTIRRFGGWVGPWVALVIAVLLTLVIAWVIHWSVERPLVGRMRRAILVGLNRDLTSSADEVMSQRLLEGSPVDCDTGGGAHRGERAATDATEQAAVSTAGEVEGSRQVGALPWFTPSLGIPSGHTYGAGVPQPSGGPKFSDQTGSESATGEEDASLDKRPRWPPLQQAS